MILSRRLLKKMSLYHIRTMHILYSVFRMMRVESFLRYLVIRMRNRILERKNLRRSLNLCVCAMLKIGKRYVSRVSLLLLRQAVRIMSILYRCPDGTTQCNCHKIQLCIYVCISKTY